jgi:hypothetical protein
MCMIFDNFPTREQADNFAAEIKQRFFCRVDVFGSQEDMETPAPAAFGGNRDSKLLWDVFPFQLTAPIVLVDRDGDYTQELQIEKAVVLFGGTFAGT